MWVWMPTGQVSCKAPLPPPPAAAWAYLAVVSAASVCQLLHELQHLAALLGGRPALILHGGVRERSRDVVSGVMTV